MTLTLASLKDSSKKNKLRKRCGRGPGSKIGKTCGRGQKGQGARSGYKRRHGNEGGQFPLYMKLPIRGFSRVRFQKKLDAINLDQIDHLFSDGEEVNLNTLREHGFINGPSHGLKILGTGELSKKVTITADAVSSGASEKLQKAKISVTIIAKDK